jgi:hypothetical protein
MGSHQSHDLSNRSKILAQVDLCFFLSIFLIFFYLYFLSFPIYSIILVSCPLSCVWFAGSSSLKVFLLFFLFWQVFLIYILKLAYNKLLDRTWIQVFISCGFFKIWSYLGCLSRFGWFLYMFLNSPFVIFVYFNNLILILLNFFIDFLLIFFLAISSFKIKLIKDYNF